MNVGYEEDELKPYIEPQPDYKDPRRTGGNGNSRKQYICLFRFPHTGTLEHICSFSPLTHTMVSQLRERSQPNYKLVLLRMCRHYAADGILSGGDPGLPGEPEVQ